MQFAEWHRTSVPIDDEGDDGESFGAELLDSDGDAWRLTDGELEHVGDVGRDPFGGAWPMNVND
jgi:hypothetical protein